MFFFLHIIAFCSCKCAYNSKYLQFIIKFFVEVHALNMDYFLFIIYPTDLLTSATQCFKVLSGKMIILIITRIFTMNFQISLKELIKKHHVKQKKLKKYLPD